MPLPRAAESLDAIPEHRRDLYVESAEGGYVLDPEQFEFEDTAALKGALRKERENGKTAAQLKRALGVESLDVDDIVARLKAPTPTPKGEKDADEDVERVWSKREQALRDEYAPLAEQNKTLAKRVRDLTIGTEVRAAAAKAGVFPTAITDAEMLAAKYLDERDGKVVVLDEDGDPTGMSVEKFFSTRFKELKPHLYAGTGSSGSDAEPSKRSASSEPAPSTPLAKIAAGFNARK